MIEIGDVNGTTLWAGDLLHSVFGIGLGRPRDPYFKIEAFQSGCQSPKGLWYSGAAPRRIIFMSITQSGADLIPPPEQLDMLHSEQFHMTILAGAPQEWWADPAALRNRMP